MMNRILLSLYLVGLLSGCVSNKVERNAEPTEISRDEIITLLALENKSLLEVVLKIQELADARATSGRPVDVQQFSAALDKSIEIDCANSCRLKERSR